MGDVHVHTAPHAYETNGYKVWATGDFGLAAAYFGLAMAEILVVAHMLRRRASVPWRECGGGDSWWRKKFIFMVSLIPLTLLRSWNLYTWGMFNQEAGEGEGDPHRINHLKENGDWLNAVVYWYLLAIKAMFLTVWIECNRTAGYIRWKMIYIQSCLALVLLFGALGIPQYFSIEYGRICQNYRQNDYCRKYRDITTSLAFLQALVGLLCSLGLGVSLWQWKSQTDGQYQALPSQSSLRQHARNSRDSYGSTDPDHDAPAAGGGGGGPDPAALCADARRYAGAAYGTFASLIAQSAFNIFFSWYAVGGVGLLGNSSLLTLTVLKMSAVEAVPLAMLSLTVAADVSAAEPVSTDEPLEVIASATPTSRPPSGGAAVIGAGPGRAASTDVAATSASAVANAADDDDAPPPAGAYQIE